MKRSARHSCSVLTEDIITTTGYLRNGDSRESALATEQQERLNILNQFKEALDYLWPLTSPRGG